MAHEMPRRGGTLEASPRLFHSNLLDKLSRSHPATPVIFYLPIIVFLTFYSVSKALTIVVIAELLLGYIAWTLTEYLGHRFLFHRVLPLPFGLGVWIQFLIHGVHHVHPNDRKRLVMPPLLSAPIMLIAFLIIQSLFPSSLVWPMLSGFISGYVVYDCVHYWTHHGNPKTKFGKMIKRLHMLHHFRDETRGFGVHAFWWDYVFGTAHLRSTSLRQVAQSSVGDANSG